MSFKFVRSPKSEAKWFEFNGCDLLVAPANNKYYMQALFEQIKYSDLASANSETDLLANLFRSMSTAEAHAVVARLSAKSLLLDWRGIEDEDDKPVEYSVENATELLRMESELRAFVENKSHELFVAANEAVADVKKK